MEIKLKSCAQNIGRVECATRLKLYKALIKLHGSKATLFVMAGGTNRYRYKIAHYRILFEYNKATSLY
jgi:mRNA-degrading endonuclease RelE of RelBE toxin-antitoxin system